VIVPCSESQTVKYRVTSATLAKLYLHVVGYQFPL